ncbi:MAG TPA: restriction endonuclease [Frankiaceae bacterium]|jgi:hypothetical protein|nr:restriction endonuclease [Frankiaceae bacterium]
MTVNDDESVSRATAHYSPAEISPAEFERFVVELLDAASPNVDGLTVTLHERITGVDGTYDFDATVRFELAGVAFLVLVEAKRHANPIKQELIQVLHQKVQSVGAHKGVMIATAPYQNGALDYAKVHGIALATVTEGRFTYETKALGGNPVMSRQEARDQFGLPTFVAHVYGQGDQPGSTRVTLLSPEYPECVVEEVLGVAVAG